MIRILYIIDDLRSAGAQRHLFELLNALNRKQYEPFVIAINTGGEIAEEISSLGIRVDVLGLNNIYSFKTINVWIYILKFIWKKKIDIVHTYLLLGDIFGVSAGLFSFSKLITTRREVGLKKRHIPIYKVLNIFSHCIIAVSNAAAEWAMKNEAIPQRKIQVVYNGINPNKFCLSVNVKRKRQELGFNENDLLLVVVANLLPVKGHRFLVRAVSSLVKENYSFKVILVGEGSEYINLKNMVVKYNLEENIYFLGSRTDVIDILFASDIFILPSLSEGMSNALIEAMFAGKAIIATAVGGNVEVIEDNMCGLLAQPGCPESLASCIKYLIDFPEKRKLVANEALSRAHSQFTAYLMAKKTERIYEGLFKKN